MGTYCSMHSRCLLHTCSLADTCSFRHPHLSMCTRFLMHTLLIVPLLWLTHFIQATLAWAVSLHESKPLWLTHFQSCSCLVLHPSPSVFQIYSCCTQFCDCCTAASPFFFHSACLCCLGHLHILSMHPACPLLCLPPFTISTTIQQQLQPANLSIFPSCMFLCHSSSYQSA